MDIEFETSLWTHISALLEKNSTKKEVSRNEPFSGHSFSFPTRAKIAIFQSAHLSVVLRMAKTIHKTYITTSMSVFTPSIIDTCLLSINKSFLKIVYFPFIFTLLYNVVK